MLRHYSIQLPLKPSYGVPNRNQTCLRLASNPARSINPARCLLWCPIVGSGVGWSKRCLLLLWDLCDSVWGPLWLVATSLPIYTQTILKYTTELCWLLLVAKTCAMYFNMVFTNPRTLGNWTLFGCYNLTIRATCSNRLGAFIVKPYWRILRPGLAPCSTLSKNY